MSSPTTDDARLAEAVAEVRELVAVDGGDLIVDDSDATSVTLRLVLDTAECRECVMPRAFLETVALDVMRDHLPGLTNVTIIDPRDR